MDKRKVRSSRTKSVPTKPAFEEMAKSGPNARKSKNLPASTRNSSTNNRTPVSRSVQVDQEDLDRFIFRGTNSTIPKMDADDEPVFLPGGFVMDSQCRFCLRTVEKSLLTLIDQSLKAKMRACFKHRVYPYDSYPYICVNCVNLIYTLVDFKESLAKTKILLRKAKIDHTVDDDPWFCKKYMESTTLCREMMDHNRKRIDEMHDEHKQFPKNFVNVTIDSNESFVKEDIEDKMDHYEEHTEFQEEFLEVSNVEYEDENGFVEVKIEHDVDGEVDAEAVVTEERLDDSDYEVNNESHEESGGEDDEWKETPIKRTKGRPKKEISSSDLKLIPDPEPTIPRPKKVFETHFTCPICDKTVHRSTKESHINQHCGITPYTCPIEGCDHKFHGKYHRSRHLNRIHRKQICDVCGKHVTNTANAIKDHMMHHETTEESVECEICGKKFWTHKYLRKHMIVHTDLFPHNCRYCGKKFKQKFSKDTHEKNVHEKKNDYGESSGTWRMMESFDSVGMFT